MKLCFDVGVLRGKGTMLFLKSNIKTTQPNQFLIKYMILNLTMYKICFCADSNVVYVFFERPSYNNIIWKIFLPLQFKNITCTLKYLMIFISYLTPITDMASSFKFWYAKPSPSLDWEMWFAVLNLINVVLNFWGNRLRYFQTQIQFWKYCILPLDDSLISLCHFCIYWSKRSCSTDVFNHLLNINNV